MLQWVYLMHELDEAAEKISNNQLSATSGEAPLAPGQEAMSESLNE
jgi:hypothetical protein